VQGAASASLFLLVISPRFFACARSRVSASIGIYCETLPQLRASSLLALACRSIKGLEVGSYMAPQMDSRTPLDSGAGFCLPAGASDDIAAFFHALAVENGDPSDPITAVGAEGFVAPPPSPVNVNAFAARSIGTIEETSVPLASSTTSGAGREGRVAGRSIAKARHGARCRASKGRRAIPRCDRVWRRCQRCGQRNHVRRIFCTSCFEPRRRT